MKPKIDKIALRADYLAGMSTRALGLKYGRNHNSILYMLRRLGVHVRSSGAPLGNQNAKGGPGHPLPGKPPIDNEQLRAEYEAGSSTLVLGRKYQRSPDYISRRLHKLGATLRSRSVRR